MVLPSTNIMGNRAHWDLLKKYPWLRRKVRGYHANGPDKGQKRIWNHKLRAAWRRLSGRDPDEVSWPTRAGDRWDWY